MPQNPTKTAGRHWTCRRTPQDTAGRAAERRRTLQKPQNAAGRHWTCRRTPQDTAGRAAERCRTLQQEALLSLGMADRTAPVVKRTLTLTGHNLAKTGIVDLP